MQIHRWREVRFLLVNAKGRVMSSSRRPLLLLAMNDYRNSVYDELMYTVFDPHDILGNTVYKFGFKATVILGGSRNSSSALIIVSFIDYADRQDHEHLRSDWEEYGAQAQEDLILDRDYEHIYSEWLDILRQNLDDAKRGVVSALDHRVERPQFEKFIDDGICKLIATHVEAGKNSRQRCFEAIDRWASEEAKQDTAVSLKRLQQDIDHIAANQPGGFNPQDL